jgi:hypothetical protein
MPTKACAGKVVFSAILDDESEKPYDLFLGVPRYCVLGVVAASGMTANDWIPVTLIFNTPKLG